MARNYSNTTIRTTLASPIGASDTLLQVSETTGMPASFPFTLILDHETASVEVVTVTGTSGPNFVVTRAQDGTSGQAHDSGAVVVHGVTARDLKEPQDHIDASVGVHGLGEGSELVGTVDEQTLTNKTIAAADNTLTVDLGDLDDVDASDASEGDALVFDGSEWVPRAGYRLMEIIHYTSSDTFTKANHPGLRAVLAKAQGAGGGGGVGGSGDSFSNGAGGGGGAYGETWFDADDLDAEETVTVGSGGSGAATGPTGAHGQDGGNSSFSTLVCGGGAGGHDAAGSAGPLPAAGGVATGADFTIPGGPSTAWGSIIDLGGDAFLGSPGHVSLDSNGDETGLSGIGYGAGGVGGDSSNTAPWAGGDGADGIVILELYG